MNGVQRCCIGFVAVTRKDFAIARLILNKVLTERVFRALRDAIN